MSDVRPLLWLIPGLPLAAAFLIALLGPSLFRQRSHIPCILAIAGACVCAVLVFRAVYAVPAEGGQEVEAGEAKEHARAGPPTAPEPTRPAAIETYYSWFQVGPPADATAGTNPIPRVNVGFTLRADALSATMLVMITFIGTLIATFAAGYMAGEGGYPRFFASVSLFIFAMTTLVLADNFIVLYAGWEGVGLCSFLLIGFWFTKPSAAAAARKAFLVTRIGDVGLMLGILLFWWGTTVYARPGDPAFSFEYRQVFAAARDMPTWVVTLGCLLLFCGAAGKSAQFPLHVWLPDAMEGPTPVSALIHAATMVTAGVYLVARCTPLFVLAPAAQLTVGIIGGITALLAALIALTQTDLKRVLAYSTLSQLGYMFLALGCAIGTDEHSLAAFAVVAAMFHLFTHAFFKALLFLSAGSVMHAMGGVIDMRRFSGLRHVMPYTHWTFLCGALALSGFPLLSGFWSKDEIIGALALAGEHSHPYGGVYWVLFGVAFLTAALTAFYTFRAYFMTFWGEQRIPEEAFAHAHGGHGGHGDAHGDPHPTPHAHEVHHEPQAHTPPGHGGHGFESPPVMTVPLVILAVFALGVGAALGPTELFAHFIERTPGLPEGAAHGMNYVLMGVSGLIAVGGIGVAYVMYGQPSTLPAQLAKSLRPLYELSYNKFFFDELYQAFLVNPLLLFTQFAAALDYYLVDGLVDLIGNAPRLLGYLYRPVQNGLVQFYALAMVLSLAVLLLSLVYYL